MLNLVFPEGVSVVWCKILTIPTPSHSTHVEIIPTPSTQHVEIIPTPPITQGLPSCGAAVPNTRYCRVGQIGTFIRVIQIIIIIHKIRTAIILVVSCSVGLIKLLLNVSIAYDFKV